MLTTTLIGVASAPAASVPFASHVTALPRVVQSHPVPPFADTRFSGVGTVSVTTSESPESLGPRLVTCKVYVSAFVPESKLPVWLFTMRTSADCVTGVTSVDVLLARCGSNVALLTLPVFVIDVPTNDGESVNPIEISGSLWPAGSTAALLQVSTCPAATQTHPDPALPVNASLLGRVSDTVIGPAASLGPRFETASVYVYASPETNGPLSVLTMRRSALVAKVLLTVDVLFALLGSGVGLFADAVLTTVCDSRLAASETVNVIGFAEAPAASAVARVQVTTPPGKPHDHPVPVAETNPSVPGSVSVTVSVAAASLGPALATCSEYVAFWPATSALVSVLTIETSADRMVPAWSVLTLLPGVGSLVGLDTVAVLSSVPTVTPEAIATVIDSESVPPLAMPVGFVQTSAPATTEQLQPTLMLTKVSPVGSGSLMVIGPAASLGPLFVMVKS